MALIDYDNELEQKPKKVESLIEPKHHKSTLLDTEYVPRANIITHIAGSAWNVDFYSQVLNDDSALYGHSPGKDALNQSYIKTVNYTLRVTSPLSTSQDSNTNAMIVTGSANTYPFLKPNQGDMFVADIGDGRTGIFRITNVEEKSIYKESSASIDYVLVSYADGIGGKKRFDDMESKVIQTRHFVMEFMNYHQNPYLTSDDYNIYQQLSIAYKEMVDNYYRLFTSKKLKAIIVPCQKEYVYDPFMSGFLNKAFDGNSTPKASYVKQFNVSEDYWMSLPTILDAILDRDTDLLNYITTRVSLVSAYSFTREPMLEGIYYSGVKEVVYPVNPIPDIDSGKQVFDKALTRHLLTPSNDTKSILNHEGTPLIRKACSDGHYIFGKDFYERTSHMTVLEACVWRYLENKPIDLHSVKALVDNHHQWGSLERFYYVPIILLLIKAIIRGF